MKRDICDISSREVAHSRTGDNDKAIRFARQFSPRRMRTRVSRIHRHAFKVNRFFLVFSRRISGGTGNDGGENRIAQQILIPQVNIGVIAFLVATADGFSASTWFKVKGIWTQAPTPGLGRKPNQYSYNLNDSFYQKRNT